MRIGILNADRVPARLAHRYGDYPAMFRALLSLPSAIPAGTPAPTFADIDVLGGALPPPDGCDAYVITGSRHSVYDDLPWIPPLVEFVAAALRQRRRVVGICFGHQLLAHHFGGETRPAPGGWCVGVHEARLVASACWLQPPARRFKLLVSHQDQVVRLPPDARAIAVAERCPLAGFVMGDALALQGHPEFSKGYAAALMDARREILGDALHRDGMTSLREEPDTALVAGWMLRFMGAR